MDLRDVGRALARRWFVVALVTLVGVGLSIAYLALAPRTYQATATAVLAPSDSTSIADAQQGESLVSSLVTTAAAVIATPLILDPVAAQHGMTGAELAEAVSATARVGTSVIDVSVSGPDPERAAEIANAIVQEAVERVPDLLVRSAPGSPTSVALSQLAPAATPQAPASPNTQGSLALGLISGLSVGLALAIAWYALDTRIRGVSDLRTLGVPVLGAIPSGGRANEDALSNVDSRVSDAFRRIRASIADDPERRALLVVSATRQPSAGHVAAGLARSFAQSYRSTVLVDLDFRDRVVSRLLGVPTGPGVADALSGHPFTADLVRPTAYGSLFVLPAGTPGDGDDDLLSSPILAELIRALTEHHAQVIVHAPAVLESSDAAIAARITDDTVLVTRRGTDRIATVEAALDVMNGVGVVPAGIVLEGVRTPSSS